MITDDIEMCINALTQGELVAFPTETVYGLGARADFPSAIAKIFKLKGRPTDHPLIMHCASIDVALAISPYVPDYAKKLASEFWPGPMTLIFKRGANDAICDEAVGGNDSVAIRVPSNEIARELLSSCTFFVAAPSANKFSKVSSTTSAHVQEQFDDELIILDGEQSSYGLESTIISCIDETPAILRTGAITKNEIQNILGVEVEDKSTSSEIKVSGNKQIHYSPNIPLFLVDNDEQISSFTNFDTQECAYIGGRETQLEFKFPLVVLNYELYAHELYDFFHRAQDQGCKAIFAVPPEAQGIGIAINDRLKKASSQWEKNGG